MRFSCVSPVRRAALACVALLAALAALAAAPALAGGDGTVINAALSGAAIGGVTPNGSAEFRQRDDGTRRLEVEVEHVNLPAGTVLNVLVNNQSVGTVTLDALHAGRIELETEKGQAVPAVNSGAGVVVANQSGASVVSGAFGSASPTPTPTPTSTPTATPTPGATPTPTPAMNEFEAKLSGAPINGVTPKGEAEFELEGANSEFRARIENVNLPAGTALDVLVDGAKVGTVTVASGLQRSELRLKTEDGQSVPAVNSRTRVVVADASGLTVVAGSFSNVPPQPTPTPGASPTPTPASNGEVRIEARLAGAPINGLTPTGEAKFRSREGRRSLEVEVERVNLPAGTVLNVSVDGVKIGELTINPTLENEFEVESERGQFVPDVTNTSTVVVSNAQGQTVVSGVFNTAGMVTQLPNDIDATTFFVEQQYRDFLGREADDPGLGFWASQIAGCDGDAACVQRSRVNTSGAFFLSIEFQQTGYMLYLFNKASFGVMPRRNAFLVDMQAAAQGVVVGRVGWEQKLEDNKRRVADAWVERPEFHSRFDGLTDDRFVDALFRNAGVQPTQAERDALVNGLRSHTETRAAVLRKVSDNAEFRRDEQNPAFVLMQYFGYLHRNPDEGPDADMSGFNFWLKKLDDNGGDFHKAEMVRAFIEAAEYRHRFEW